MGVPSFFFQALSNLLGCLDDANVVRGDLKTAYISWYDRILSFSLSLAD